MCYTPLLSTDPIGPAGGALRAVTWGSDRFVVGGWAFDRHADGRNKTTRLRLNRSQARPGAPTVGKAPNLPRTTDPGGTPPTVLASPRGVTKGRGREKTLVARGAYPLPEELARHAPRERFAPDELRGACRGAGEGLGREDAKEATFRTAPQMVEMWRGLDLPAWEAPYVLREARLGYLHGYERALTSGDMSEEQISYAAESRWGQRWPERLRAARERSG